MTASTIPASTSPASAQYTSDSDFQAAILNSTNTYRTQHNATALVWNDTLATYAATYATKCDWGHSHGPSGENLAEDYANVTDAVDGWGDEREKYDFGNGGFSEATGHFTQLVWKATTSVGCGRVDCDGKGGSAQGWFVVCEYWPAGNVEGQFAQEVGREIRTFTVKGGGEAAGYIKYLVNKVNGAGKRSWSGWGIWLVGLGILVGILPL
ncbi:hypothetical protein P7C71_g1964, partial [Lecanoromycetidae sp. Uapishka_2]